MRPRPSVALIVESSRVYGRGLLRGIAAYSRVHGPWSIAIEERAIYEGPPAWLHDWQGDGIISRIHTRELESFLRETGKPVVDVHGSLDETCATSAIRR